VKTDPIFFETPEAFRAWLERHHAEADELTVGFYKKSTGKPSITWPESVDEALCFGWIDGVRRSLGLESYTIRFTPRRPGSTWSKVNIGRVQVLIEQGRMKPAGLAAFEARSEERSGIYSFEQESVELPEQYAASLREDEAAWRFFHEQAASYRKAVTWWIVSAKKEETRAARLEKLKTHCAAGQRLPQFSWKKACGPGS
jgi:uncharacterized protein YdeI (YjbR/CyaY-like superfamily)